MVDHPFTDKHALVRLSLSFPAHLFALIIQEGLRNRERVYLLNVFNILDISILTFSREFSV